MSSSWRQRRQLTPILLVCFITYLSYRNLFSDDSISPPSLRPDLPPNASPAPPPVSSSQPPAHHFPIHPTTDFDDDGFDDADESKHHRPQIIEDESYFDSSDFPTLFPVHRYRGDGYLLVNPEGRHPIHDLIQRAQSKWDKKQKARSHSLGEACAEYRRRHRRDPPPGFNHWWDYVVKNDIKLPDEYDFLHANLEPLWGIDPKYLQERRKEWEDHSEVFTIGKLNENDPVTLLKSMPDVNGNFETGKWRAKLQLDIINDIGKFIPPFKASFISGDVPYQFVSWEMKHRAKEAAKKNQHMDFNQMPFQPYLGWASACPPSKPLHKDKYDVHPPIAQFHNATPKSFIFDHPKSMDPCIHPELVHYVGYLSNHLGGPGPAIHYNPAFAISTTPIHGDILAVSPEGYTEDVGKDPEWKDKKDNRLFWRGSTTGASFETRLPWQFSHRIRLMSQSIDKSVLYNVLNTTSGDGAVGNATQIVSDELNKKLLDVGFTGKPIQCSDPICKQLADMYEFKGHVSQEAANNYKFMLDVDGNAWSARFKRLMTTKSCILKTTMFPEWYVDRVQEWVHYVPVKVDLSDLYDIMTFFQENDHLAESIGAAGRDWSLWYYRREDMAAYMFRLFLEYSRLMRDDRQLLRTEC